MTKKIKKKNNPLKYVWPEWDNYPEEFKNDLREEFVEILKMGKIRVKFRKLDGTIRSIDCTLNPTKIPMAANDSLWASGDPPFLWASRDLPFSNKSTAINIIRAFDLNEYGWKSFRMNSVMDFNCVEQYD